MLSCIPRRAHDVKYHSRNIVNDLEEIPIYMLQAYNTDLRALLIHSGKGERIHISNQKHYSQMSRINRKCESPTNIDRHVIILWGMLGLSVLSSLEPSPKIDKLTSLSEHSPFGHDKQRRHTR